MAQISYLKKRGSTYYAQQAVPLDLQEPPGAKTREKSLQTKDPQEAKRLLRPVLDASHKSCKTSNIPPFDLPPSCLRLMIGSLIK